MKTRSILFDATPHWARPLGVVAMLAACAPHTVVTQPPAVATISPDATPLPPFDPPEPGAESINTEYYLGSAAQEKAAFESYATQIQGIQDQQAREHDQPTQRGFHAKAHGCVAGWFQLFPDRDARTRFGVFADDAKPMPVWVRFSNGVGWQQGDGELDARGMAVKVMGVAGAKLSDEESQTQDFLMTNAPTPVGRNADDFMKFAHSNANGKLSGLAFAASHPRAAGPALTSTGPIASAAAEQYWSGGAFHLGAHQAVKFTAKPCSFDRAREPDGSGKNRLREDLATAAARGMCFVFYVQFQSDPFRTPIENASREWSEQDAPLVRVGKIQFPPQDIAQPGEAELCKSLSFNPWHAIAVHQPMGNINRARRYVYTASRTHRAGTQEPFDFMGFGPPAVVAPLTP
ncbi:catalase family protein [soil metagenome]